MIRRLVTLSLLVAFIPCAQAREHAAFTLFQAMRHQGGVAVAPSALWELMMLLYYGSSGPTEETLKGSLFGGLPRSEAPALAAQRSHQAPGYRVIPSIWLSDQVHPQAAFTEAATEHWACPVGLAALATNPIAAARTINAWYEHQTNGFIRQVIEAPKIPDQCDLAAVTVAAFAAPWAQAYFDPANTRLVPFQASPEETFQVAMMHTKDRLPYFQDRQYQALSLDFADKQYSLLVILPLNPRAFEQTVAQFNHESFVRTLRGMRDRPVELSLPKVNLTSTLDWREIFLHSTLTEPFTPDAAEFKNLNEAQARPHFIGILNQEVMVRWEEHTTEDPPTERSPDRRPGDPPEPSRFNADHPFLFIIYHKEDRAIHFIGQITSLEQMPRR